MFTYNLLLRGVPVTCSIDCERSSDRGVLMVNPAIFKDHLYSIVSQHASQFPFSPDSIMPIEAKTVFDLDPAIQLTGSTGEYPEYRMEHREGVIY